MDKDDTALGKFPDLRARKRDVFPLSLKYSGRESSNGVPPSEQKFYGFSLRADRDSPIGRRPNVGVGSVDIQRGAPEGEGRPALPPPALLENPVLSLLEVVGSFIPSHQRTLHSYSQYVKLKTIASSIGIIRQNKPILPAPSSAWPPSGRRSPSRWPSSSRTPRSACPPPASASPRGDVVARPPAAHETFARTGPEMNKE